MKRELAQLRPTIESLFDHFHQNPEVSWEEFKTTEFIQSYLEQQGFSVQTFDDCTGLIVEAGSGDFCIGLRTDMDALWQEVNGIYKANHSCGHDAHMTMVIGTMLLLKNLNMLEKAKFKFIFQPAEEKGTGALKMVEKKVVDDVDFLYGVHLRPIQELEDGCAVPAIYHGAAKFITGEIIGEDAHGARPHLGQNAIEIGAAIVNEIKGIHLDPMVPYTAKMTKFHAGGDSGNIIPGKAAFSLDLRAQSNKVMEELTKKVEHIFQSISSLHGVEITFETKANVAAAEVHLEAVQYMKQAIEDTLGEKGSKGPIISSGGEDFHFYTLRKPSIKATMLGLGCGLTPGLHHPNMTFNHEAMFSGIEILTKTMINTLERQQEGE